MVVEVDVDCGVDWLVVDLFVVDFDYDCVDEYCGVDFF